MANPARYADDVADGIRRLLSNSGVVLPPPGAARAAGNAADVVIDPDIAARAARQMNPDFSNVQGIPDAVLPFTDPSVVARLDGAMPPAPPNMDLGTPLFDQMSKSAGAFDNTLKGRTANLRNQPFAKPAQAAIQDANARSAKMRAGMQAAAERGEVMKDVGTIGGMVTGAGALGAGALALTSQGTAPKMPAAPAAPPTPPPAPPARKRVDPLFEDKGALTNTGGTAELANEARPVPAVATSNDPRAQAQELIKQLNAGHRAGTITPAQDQQMRAEIDRLLALSNQKRNAMTPQQARGSNDPHMQAQALIAQLNEMRAAQPGGGEVPQAQQMMAEVRRLQAMGDQQRNYAQTR
jgi:hypothetical protein